MKWRLELSVLSQFFKSLFVESNQAKLLSTIHLFGSTLNLCNSLLLTTSTSAFITFFTSFLNFIPVYHQSTSIFFTSFKYSLFSLINVTAQSLSVIFAVVTTAPTINQNISTNIFLLIPETFFQASYHLFADVLVFFTL